MIACDLCGADNSRLILNSRRLDGPLVRCNSCGLSYVGLRQSSLAFGSESPVAVADRVRRANVSFPDLRLEEESRLARINARSRLKLIRNYRQTGRLLEIGCARGDFLNIARDFFDVHGVEPNPELAGAASRVAPIHHDVVETLSVGQFDVAASFHVIEHVDSPNRFLRAIVERVRVGGLVVIETPNIQSAPFNLMRSRWRQFIPEHYFFFNPGTLRRLLESNGLRVEAILNVGKYASLELLLNRLSRYSGLFRPMGSVARSVGLSRLTFHVNPRDIMFAVATKLPVQQP